eukprot:scaffold63121_cov69-Phaeocystis_antarctica.AAC.6
MPPLDPPSMSQVREVSAHVDGAAVTPQRVVPAAGATKDGDVAGAVAASKALACLDEARVRIEPHSVLHLLASWLLLRRSRSSSAVGARGGLIGSSSPHQRCPDGEKWRGQARQAHRCVAPTGQDAPVGRARVPLRTALAARCGEVGREQLWPPRQTGGRPNRSGATGTHGHRAPHA